MIDAIANAIEGALKGLKIFKAVERTVNTKILQSPPSVAFFLAYDRQVANKPTATRDLGWDLLLMIPALGVGKGGKSAGDCIDTVRSAFIGWRPWTSGGVLPAEVPEIKLEGIEQTVLVYTARLTMRVMPDLIKEVIPAIIPEIEPEPEA
ncbi:MAG: hypothetical protein KJ630_01190 [Proteobacteria bacterium]|nr:hypothetical protein [Pseudomonadota bacterium]